MSAIDDLRERQLERCACTHGYMYTTILNEVTSRTIGDSFTGLAPRALLAASPPRHPPPSHTHGYGRPLQRSATAL